MTQGFIFCKQNSKILKIRFSRFFKILKFCRFRVSSHFTSLYIPYSRLILSMEMYFDTGIDILQAEFENIENWIFKIFSNIKGGGLEF